ncbi:hypothetical protein ABPG75_009514 [Micractinium tetrahymenae]
MAGATDAACLAIQGLCVGLNNLPAETPLSKDDLLGLIPKMREAGKRPALQGWSMDWDLAGKLDLLASKVYPPRFHGSQQDNRDMMLLVLDKTGQLCMPRTLLAALEHRIAAGDLSTACELGCWAAEHEFIQVAGPVVEALCGALGSPEGATWLARTPAETMPGLFAAICQHGEIMEGYAGVEREVSLLEELHRHGAPVAALRALAAELSNDNNYKQVAACCAAIPGAKAAFAWAVMLSTSMEAYIKYTRQGVFIKRAGERDFTPFSAAGIKLDPEATKAHFSSMPAAWQQASPQAPDYIGFHALNLPHTVLLERGKKKTEQVAGVQCKKRFGWFDKAVRQWGAAMQLVRQLDRLLLVLPEMPAALEAEAMAEQAAEGAEGSLQPAAATQAQLGVAGHLQPVPAQPTADAAGTDAAAAETVVEALVAAEAEVAAATEGDAAAEAAGVGAGAAAPTMPAPAAGAGAAEAAASEVAGLAEEAPPGDTAAMPACSPVQPARSAARNQPAAPLAMQLATPLAAPALAVKKEEAGALQKMEVDAAAAPTLVAQLLEAEAAPVEQAEAACPAGQQAARPAAQQTLSATVATARPAVTAVTHGTQPGSQRTASTQRTAGSTGQRRTRSFRTMRDEQRSGQKCRLACSLGGSSVGKRAASGSSTAKKRDTGDGSRTRATLRKAAQKLKLPTLEEMWGRFRNDPARFQLDASERQEGSGESGMDGTPSLACALPGEGSAEAAAAAAALDAELAGGPTRCMLAAVAQEEAVAEAVGPSSKRSRR